MCIHLDRAIEFAGGQTALAKLLNVSPQLVWQWAKDKRPVGPLKAKAIEELTGGAVKRHELRPDIYDAPRKGRATA